MQLILGGSVHDRAISIKNVVLSREIKIVLYLKLLLKILKTRWFITHHLNLWMKFSKIKIIFLKKLDILNKIKSVRAKLFL